MSRFCVPLSGPIDKHPALRFEIGSLVILVHRPIDPTVLPDKKKLLHTRGEIYPDTESRICRKENRVTLEGGEALVKQGN